MQYFIRQIFMTRASVSLTRLACFWFDGHGSGLRSHRIFRLHSICRVSHQANIGSESRVLGGNDLRPYRGWWLDVSLRTGVLVTLTGELERRFMHNASLSAATRTWHMRFFHHLFSIRIPVAMTPANAAVGGEC